MVASAGGPVIGGLFYVRGILDGRISQGSLTDERGGHGVPCPFDRTGPAEELKKKKGPN
jgi:hypothetical protein